MDGKYRLLEHRTPAAGIAQHRDDERQRQQTEQKQAKAGEYLLLKYGVCSINAHLDNLPCISSIPGMTRNGG